MAKLGDICTINMGQSPESSSYNTIGKGLPFFQGNADFGDIHPTIRTWCSNPIKIAKKGDLLISVRAPIGALNIANNQCCIGRGLAAITNYTKNIYKDYLWFALLSKIDELKSKGTGSTFKAINKKILAETDISLPSLEKQKQIAKQLSCLDTLLSKRKQQLSKLDQLVKSRFVEMFGDPTLNIKMWDIYPLGNRCQIITGNTPSRAEKDNYGNFIEWIKSNNINKNEMYISKAEEFLSLKGFSKGRYVESGSLLMTCIAGSVSCIGNIAISNRRVAFNQQINAIIPKIDNKFYIYWLIKLSQENIHTVINKSLKGILSKSQLSAIKFPFPPLPLQEQFAEFVQQVDKIKSPIKQSLEKLETLKKSLMQEYFG